MKTKKTANMFRLILVTIVTLVCFSMTVTAEPLEETDPFAFQKTVDEGLKQEMEAGYSFEEAAVILDPYNCSPLSAVIIFTTDEETDVTVNVKGKDEKDTFTGTFPAETQHLIPVYGLYNGDVTEVELVLGDGRSHTFEVETELNAIPADEITVDMIQPEMYDYSKLTLVCSLGGVLYGLDSAGDVRWYYTGGGSMGVHPLQNGHLMTPTTFVVRPSYYRSGLQEIDLSGKVYCEYAIPGGQHHDFYEMENGNLLVAGDQQDLAYIEDYVVEIDRETGDVVWELDLKDILPIEDGMSASMNSDGTEELDWFHNNSLWYDAENDLVLLSGRHKDAIVAVNKTDKTLAWILGDPTDWNEVDASYFFTPEGEDFEWFYAQHQITMLDNGDVMLFDNGTAKVKRSDDENRVKGDDVYSRAVVYHLDTDNMTVSQVCEYGKERGAEWYSDWISGVESLDGTADLLWITAGSHLYDPHEDTHGLGPADMFKPDLVKSTHIDMTVNNELAYEIVISGDAFGALSFRTLRYAPYAEGSGLDISASAQLKGSFGETAQTEPETEITEAEIGSAEPLNKEGWTFNRDQTKISFTGSYQTETPADELGKDYLILENEGEIRTYAIVSNAVNGEDKTGVNVRGWVAMDGLTDSYRLLLSLDGQIYDTGYTI